MAVLYHSTNKLPPPVHPLSILGLPGIAQNMCVIAQYTCIPEILFTTLCFKLLFNFDV